MAQNKYRFGEPLDYSYVVPLFLSGIMDLEHRTSKVMHFLLRNLVPFTVIHL